MRCGFPSQDQEGFGSVGKHVDLHFLQQTLQQFLAIPIGGGGRIPDLL